MDSKNPKIDKSKIILFTGIAIILIFVIALSVKAIIKNKDKSNDSVTQTTIVETEEVTKGPDYSSLSPLTGLPDFKAEGKRPVAFMINNSAKARPHWGLCTPDIVFEGITEGGITRMLWLYADINDVPDKIGSMRSARHDFIELAEGMDALFVHWGGSKYAYDAIEDRGIDHLDGLVYAEKLFFRDPNRNVGAEHRGYTTRKNVIKGFDKRNARLDIKNGYDKPFKFSLPNEKITPDAGTCSKLYFEFSNYCNHTFTYDEESSLYYNRINGEPMKDSDGKQMAVTNVILLYCSVDQMGDSAGCIDMNLTSGKGTFISNGAYENISWEKGSHNKPLKLYNSNGDELTLNAGKSYIAFVPNSRSATLSISE